MELNFFQLNQWVYFVPRTLKLPGLELALAQRGGDIHSWIDCIGEVRDQLGATIADLREKLDIRHPGLSSSELARQSVRYDAGFTLFPGRYTIKHLARDAETGRIGTVQTKFALPDLNQPGPNIPISSVVLSSQLTDWSSAVCISQRNAGSAANPLVQASKQLLPSVPANRPARWRGSSPFISKTRRSSNPYPAWTPRCRGETLEPCRAALISPSPNCPQGNTSVIWACRARTGTPAKKILLFMNLLPVVSSRAALVRKLQS